MDINFDSPHSTPSLLFSDFKSKLNITPARGSTVDVNKFGLDGFSDFELDLGCLSRSPSPSSPAGASFSSEHDSPSRPTSPSPPTVSTFSPTPPSQAVNIASAKISPKTAASAIRASWPVLRYVGRGTPVDPTRRSQWGGYEAAEDGRLHSGNLRSTSLDSAIRASGPAHRSASPDWHHVSSESPVQPFVLPEESKIQFDVQQSDPSEWDAFMQTVLGQTSSSSTTGSAPSVQPSPPRTPSPPQTPVKQELLPLTDVPVVETTDLDIDSTDLDIDLGLDAALDLGLGVGRGMNWFELGIIPSSGFDSPSVYSSPPETGTPRGSRPVSIDNSTTGFVPGPPPSQSTVNGNGNGNENGYHNSKLEERTETKSFYGPGTEAWWRKLIEKLRKLQKLLHRRKVVHSD